MCLHDATNGRCRTMKPYFLKLLKILYKITFRLCVWGIWYISFLFRLRNIPKVFYSVYIHTPKYENSEICNMSVLTLLDKGYSSSVHETSENTMRDCIGLLSLAVIYRRKSLFRLMAPEEKSFLAGRHGSKQQVWQLELTGFIISTEQSASWNTWGFLRQSLPHLMGLTS